jgi:RimJ/RimL family protein N-acetyltransferase
MPETPFVPEDFAAPSGLATPRFRLEPLGPQHNERDYAAWTSSVDHIHATPGLTAEWPHEMTLAENRADLERHERDFAKRTGFTYTVLDPDDGDVIGCVYIYPLKDVPGAAHVTSWVRADRAELDVPLAEAVSGWLAEAWPFERVEYAGRGG